MNTRSNPPDRFFQPSELPVRTRRKKTQDRAMAEAKVRSKSTSESEGEGSIVENMPPPDQDPPRLPDLEVIRNKRSQSRQKSVRPQKTEGEDNSSDWWKNSQTVQNETWRDRRAESTQREQRQREEKFWDRDKPRLKRAKSMSSVIEAGTGGLLEVLSHLSKPIAVLSRKDTRDDDLRLKRNFQHLDRITDKNLQGALLGDLSSLTTHLKRLDLQVEKLSESHKLASRVDTAKKTPIQILMEYPVADATPTIYRQASAAFLQLIKNMAQVKDLTMAKDSYSYLLELVDLSNIIANQFILSESQQFSLILDCLPANSSEYGVLNRCQSLSDLFSTISTFAPSILTQRELEQKLVAWKLDTRSVSALNRSLSDLLSWTEMVADSELRTIDIYHHAIGRLLQEKLSPRTLHSLQEVRLKLSEDDSITDLVQMILCSLKQLIPKNEGHAVKNILKTETGTQNHLYNKPGAVTSMGTPRAIAYMSDPNTLTQIAYYPPGYTPPSVNAINAPEKKVGKYAERNTVERKGRGKQLKSW
jgi:hypothetical protein